MCLKLENRDYNRVSFACTEQNHRCRPISAHSDDSDAVMLHFRNFFKKEVNHLFCERVNHPG